MNIIYLMMILPFYESQLIQKERKIFICWLAMGSIINWWRNCKTCN